MIGSYSKPSDRAIGIIALLQFGVVVFGTLFVCVALKIVGYNNGEVPRRFFSSAVLFVRHFGFTLLLLPAAWATGAMIAARFASRQWIPSAFIVFGIAEIFLGIWYYMYLWECVI